MDKLTKKMKTSNNNSKIGIVRLYSLRMSKMILMKRIKIRKEPYLEREFSKVQRDHSDFKIMQENICLIIK